MYIYVQINFRNRIPAGGNSSCQQLLHSAASSFVHLSACLLFSLSSGQTLLVPSTYYFFHRYLSCLSSQISVLDLVEGTYLRIANHYRNCCLQLGGFQKQAKVENQLFNYYSVPPLSHRHFWSNCLDGELCDSSCCFHVEINSASNSSGTFFASLLEQLELIRLRPCSDDFFGASSPQKLPILQVQRRSDTAR